MSEPADKFFTVVFRGDVRTIGKSLFRVVEPFGEIVAISVGDRLEELDRLLDQNVGQIRASNPERNEK